MEIEQEVENGESASGPAPRRRQGRPPAEHVAVTCAACARSFEVFPSRAKANKTGIFFCSAVCRDTTNAQGGQVATKPRRGVEKRCGVCGTLFYVPQNRAESALYCSKRCQNEGRKVGWRWDERACEKCSTGFLPKWQGQRFCSIECAGYASAGETEHACEWCGIAFTWRASEPRQFCSRPCFYAHQTANASGHVNADGYVIISINGEKKSQHRYVMERYLARPLLPNENVHHGNGDRTDNNLSNLELWSTKQPKGQRVLDKLAYAREIIALYGPEEEKLLELEALVARENRPS